MIVFPRGEVRTWSDLTPGALFGVSIRGETHLAVKIQGSGDEYHCAVLTGLPPHYVREIVVQNSLLYFFPNSKIVPVGRRIDLVCVGVGIKGPDHQQRGDRDERGNRDAHEDN